MPGFAGGEHVQAHGGGDAVPAGGAAGDHEPAGPRPGEKGLGMGRVGDVVQYDQPPVVASEPLHGPLPQHLCGQQPSQGRLQRGGQGGQPGVDPGGAGRGDPPDDAEVPLVGGGVLGGQRALADTAQPVHRQHHHPLASYIGAGGHGAGEPGKLTGAADEHARALRQIRQVRRGFNGGGGG